MKTTRSWIHPIVPLGLVSLLVLAPLGSIAYAIKVKIGGKEINVPTPPKPPLPPPPPNPIKVIEKAIDVTGDAAKDAKKIVEKAVNESRDAANKALSETIKVASTVSKETKEFNKAVQRAISDVAKELKEGRITAEDAKKHIPELKKAVVEAATASTKNINSLNERLEQVKDAKISSAAVGAAAKIVANSLSKLDTKEITDFAAALAKNADVNAFLDTKVLGDLRVIDLHTWGWQERLDVTAVQKCVRGKMVISMKEHPTTNEEEIKLRVTQAVLACVSEKLASNKRANEPKDQPEQNDAARPESPQSEKIADEAKAEVLSELAKLEEIAKDLDQASALADKAAESINKLSPSPTNTPKP